MRGILLACLVALKSCTRKPDTFTVIDPDDLAKSAVLKIDGSDQSLEREGKSLSMTRWIGRGAHGRIQVIYSGDREVDCPIGYVTPGVPQKWNFRLTTTGCEVI